MTFTTEEKLAEVEALIRDFRWARTDPAIHEYRTHAILKAIAKDLRGRLVGAPDEAEQALARRMESAIASKTPLGYASGPMIGLAEELVCRWPSVIWGFSLLRQVDRIERLLAEEREHQ